MGKLGAVKEGGDRDGSRPGVGFAGVEVTFIGHNDCALLVIDGEGILRGGMGELIQRSIDTGGDEKKADDEEGESFEEAFHDG